MRPTSPKIKLPTDIIISQLRSALNRLTPVDKYIKMGRLNPMRSSQNRTFLLDTERTRLKYNATY